MKLKKILAYISVFGLTLVNSVIPVKAAEPWDVTGSYVVGFECTPACGGPYLHDASLTQTGSTVTGDGGYPAGGPFTYHWNITSGSVSGNNINLSMTYDLGAPGTVMNMTGTIAIDGTLSGTWSDDLGGGRMGTWNTTSGNAQSNPYDEPAQCTGTYGAPIVGTGSSDDINGTPGADLIFALGGSDKVDGKGGDDCIVGGNGSDKLIGGGGSDVILGGNQSDSIEGGNGQDQLYGEDGADSLKGDNGADMLDGGDGADSLRGGDNGDTLLGGGGSDSLRGENGNDTLDGEAGTDSARGGDGTDTCTAESEQQCEL